MAVHGLSKITADSLRDRMESRHGFLDYTDQQDGCHAGEFSFLENFLETTVSDIPFFEAQGTEQSSGSTASETSFVCEGEKDSGRRCGGSRSPAGSSPLLLTGGIPSTESPATPLLPIPEVREYSHASYDGQTGGGCRGTWDESKFVVNIDILDEAKNRAAELTDGSEGVIITLAGEEVLVMPTGGRAGGLLYKYRIICRGVEILIHSNPPMGRQGIRFRYFAESLQGGRDRFYSTHFEFLIPFITRLGFTIEDEKLSRVDANVNLSVSMAEFSRLKQNGHIVRKARKRAFYGTDDVVDETIGYGNVANGIETKIYDKGKELRDKKANIIKEVDFQANCTGDEWIRSGLPITRVEFSLGSNALESFGVRTVKDLQERERAMFDLITMEWFRILKYPKVRGHENTAELHPIWERVRTLFLTHFSGAEVATVEWKRKEKLSCDYVALERQALGCLSKAFAVKYGEQSSRQSTVKIGKGWVERVQNEMHDKLNKAVEFLEVRTGFEFGTSSRSSSGYDAGQDYADLKQGRGGCARDKIYVEDFSEEVVLR